MIYPVRNNDNNYLQLKAAILYAIQFKTKTKKAKPKALNAVSIIYDLPCGDIDVITLDFLSCISLSY